jgi:hypothetical protein
MTAASFIGTLTIENQGVGLQDGQDLVKLAQANSSGKGGLTALAGGAQAGSPVLNAYITEFTTVASANDSCQLPPALAGEEFTVINSGAANLKVYAALVNAGNPAVPAVADTIIALAGGAGVGSVVIAPNAIGVFSCPTVGRWKSQNQ